MKAKIVHDKKGEIRWLAVQDSELDGELGIEVDSKDESVISVELGEANVKADLRSQEVQQLAVDVLEHFRVNVRKGKLEQRLGGTRRPTA